MDGQMDGWMDGWMNGWIDGGQIDIYGQRDMMLEKLNI